MKARFPLLISLIYFILFSFHSSAQGVSDTTALLASNTETSEVAVLVKPANILYPSSLEKHREQSLDYVQNFCEKKRSYLVWMYNKGKKYFPKVSDILKSYNLPEELKVLMALESAFKGDVVSPAGAVGYWQIMDDAAKHYGLHISDSKQIQAKDDRKNLIKSTSAAAKFLRDRGEDLNNDLLLIVASYNCGIGRIWKAIKKTGKDNPDFWDLKKYLPAETRNYVMNFIALNVILLNYESFSKKELVFVPEYSVSNSRITLLSYRQKWINLQ